MRLAGILFDKDGTLVDFDATWGAATYAVMQAMSAGRTETFSRLAEAMHFLPSERRFQPDSPMIAGSTADYVATWASILGRPSDAAFADELDRRFGVETLANLTPLGEPAVVFAALRAGGLRLGVATNDAEANARSQCDKLGLTPFLDFIAGYDSGYGRKPEPGMVVAFARRLGVPPDRIALVGDAIHDLEAARAGGALAIAVLTGPATRIVLEPRADHVIDNLADLLVLLPSLDDAC